jgi:hypothetical protein
VDEDDAAITGNDNKDDLPASSSATPATRSLLILIPSLDRLDWPPVVVAGAARLTFSLLILILSVGLLASHPLW